MADITVDQLTTQTFYQIPQIFIPTVEKKYDSNGKVIEKIKVTSRYAVKLSNDAKLAYGILYNRCLLSIRSFHQGKTDYVDDKGSVFLVYTVDDLCDVLDKGKTTVHKIKKELHEVGLLREEAQGATRPNRLYLQNVNASLQEYEHYVAHTITKGRDKGKVNFVHVKTIDFNGNVIYLNTEYKDEKWGSKNERHENPDISTIKWGSKNERHENPDISTIKWGSKNERHDVQNMNASNIDKSNTELLDNSSRKAGTDSHNHLKKSDQYIQPQYYSLLQVIADKYNDRMFCFPDVVTMTHHQKMKIGEYLESGYVISHEVLALIDRIPADSTSPLAYLYKSLENLKEERRLEAKVIAHNVATEKYEKII